MHLDKELRQLTQERASQTQSYSERYVPLFYRLNLAEDQLALAELLREKPYIQVFDTIKNQLTDLVKGLNPSQIMNEASISEAIIKRLNGVDSEVYGVWVYYPWSEKLVHMLDEEEFIHVRTNRNKHKITQSEQDHLRNKKIGVMGLSVGQSVSLTLAIERGFGELRIADFDSLDLTNLNRIRTGVENIDLKKTVIVAREIAEIDPFLKVTCFHEGITDENLDTFLTGNGKLDLLIDECDSFDIKISSRKKAKALGIPVLMEGSDRCTIDIERFDLEPERPVLHGYVDHLDMTVYKSLKTMDERIPYIAPVTGIETLSPRMKASAVEIMNTISTWPQLSSAVTYGGGITADIARKILLGNLSISGRFFIDIDDLITDKEESFSPAAEKTGNTISTAEIEKYLETHPSALLQNGEPLSKEIVEQLIASAIKAPSGGNNQPWRWHYQNNTLHLFLDHYNSGAYLDPDCISSYVSLGAAIENLLLEAAVHHLQADWKFTPELAPDHVASFTFSTTTTVHAEDQKLAAQIEKRHTNRKNGIENTLNTEELDQLKVTAEATEGLNLHWLTDTDDKRTLGDLCGQADLLRMFIPEAHYDFIHKEMRWNEDEVEQRQDGIGIHTLDLSNNDQIGLRLIKDNRTVQFLDQIKGGSIFRKLAMRQCQSSTAIGLITLPEANSLNYLKGGMAAEKLWLEAAAMGYQIHPLNVPLIFFYKQNFQSENKLSDIHSKEISALHEQFKTLFGITGNLAEIFLFRVFKASESELRTIRKPVIKTLSFGK